MQKKKTYLIECFLNLFVEYCCELLHHGQAIQRSRCVLGSRQDLL